MSLLIAAAPAIWGVLRAVVVLALVFCLRRTERWLRGANARRKRVERYLKKQQRENQDLHRRLFKVGWELGTARIENIKLKADNAALENRNRVLAAQVAQEILTAQDREGVVQGLTRKL